MIVNLVNKPFWIWNKAEHTQEYLRAKGKCCFNHIVGLSIRDKKEFPIFDYEQTLYDALLSPYSNNPLKHDFKNKYLWVKKATGLGVTEFMLSMVAGLCTKDQGFWNSQMCIVTGSNIDIAIKLIKRMKGIFE